MSETIKPFEGVGAYTAFPNAATDHIMPRCKPNTWKVVCFVIRKTIGWHKKQDLISLSQFMAGCGIKSKETCFNAVKDAYESGYLLRVKHGKSFDYTLNKGYEMRTGTETVPVIGTENGASSVRKTGTQKKKEKEIIISLEDVLGIAPKALNAPTEADTQSFKENVLDVLKVEMGMVNFDAWISDIVLGALDTVDNIGFVVVPTHQARDYVEARMPGTIKELSGFAQIRFVMPDQLESAMLLNAAPSNGD